MDISLVSILSVGFALGLKHAIEPDHVIAVSTIASHSKRLWRAALAGVFWGIGHTATLFVTGLALILLKEDIPDVWAMSLEFVVGLMLVYLGVSNLWQYRRKPVRLLEHEHDGMRHRHFQPRQAGGDAGHAHRELPYRKSFAIGLVHGLAGSAAMVLLTMSTVSTVWQGALYILVFGAGTIAGMLLFTTAIGIPFVLTVGLPSVNRALTRLTGAISTAFGLYYMYNLGISEGLFRLWFS